MLDVSLFLLGLNVSEHALPNGTEPLIFLDFKNGIYTSSGVSVAVTTLLTQNADWGTWNPATMISAGVGITGAGPPSPVLTGDAFDLVATGATILMSFSGTDVNANSALRFEMVDDLNAYNTYYYTRLSFHSGVTNNIGDQVAADETEPTLSGVAHQAALTMTDGKISRSVDGAAITTINPAAPWSPAPTVMGFIVGSGMILESVGLYPAQPDADLPMLSTL
jgi:hypothetical protein